MPLPGGRFPTAEMYADVADWWINRAPLTDPVPDSLPGYRWQPSDSAMLRRAYVMDRIARGLQEGSALPPLVGRAFVAYGRGA